MHSPNLPDQENNQDAALSGSVREELAELRNRIRLEDALERVRIRTNAMRESSELSEIISVVFQELEKLGFDISTCQFLVETDDPTVVDWWGANDEGRIVQSVKMQYAETPLLKRYFDHKRAGVAFFADIVEGEDFRSGFEYLFANTGFSKLPEERKASILERGRVARSHALVNNVALGIQNYEGVPYSDEENEILRRFAAVFDQSYTRFEDLKKAEAQAREARIEAALERILSRSMAMQSSTELLDVAAVMREEMAKLDQPELETVAIHLYPEKEDYLESWGALRLPGDEGKVVQGTFRMGRSSCELLRDLLALYEGPQDEHTLEVKTDSDRAREWTQVLREASPEMGSLIAGPIVPEQIFWHVTDFSGGSLIVVSWKEPEAEIKQIQKRLSNVFGLAYRRFADLKVAEAQTRDARIEASLERIRSRALAMQKSDELEQVVHLLFEELARFGVDPASVDIAIYDPEKRVIDDWAAQVTERGIINYRCSVSFFHHPIFTAIFQARREGRTSLAYSLRGEDKVAWDRLFLENVTGLPSSGKELMGALHAINEIHAFMVFMNRGIVVAWTTELMRSDLAELLKRFANVLDLMYTRVEDLQQSEIRAREAVRKASLDRVRAEIASMRHADDLQRITPLIWRELTTLAVPFTRCGVFIVDEATECIHTYLSTPEGESLAVLHLPFDSNEFARAALLAWRKGVVYRDEWDKAHFEEWITALRQDGIIETSRDYKGSESPPEYLALQFVPFRQGLLYVGGDKPLRDHDLDLVNSLAEAFSVAYARYEDFTSLEAAKARIEATLKDLRATQAQLIHSEKMASLGQMTAGIAHEIKNPLNFVNNFAEVNSELLEEIRDSLENGEDVRELIDDLEQNSRLINLHGKRADAIVRSMMQHASGTSGQKSETDLNEIVNEYAELALRGKLVQMPDIEIGLEKTLDANAGSLMMVPEDIGRVILNLVGNAYDAVAERMNQTAGPPYTPIVRVSTHRTSDRLEVRVSDNGVGIAPEIIDKVFEPFFTTKPTDSGTGLGLSLSYDIVTKGHGGSLRVESKPGEGATFVVSLPSE